MKPIFSIFKETLPRVSKRYVTISGPSFAYDVAKGLPTSVTLATSNPLLLPVAMKIFENQNFKTYTSKDIVGVELGGSLKNVIAIGAGILDGIKSSESTKAAFITRGLNEIKTLYPDIRINSILEKPSIVTIDNSIETVIFRGVKDELNFKKFDQFILEKLNDSPNSLNDIIISKSLLEKLNISIGDNITLYFQTFDNQKIPNIRYYRVYGVYETDFPDFDSSYIIGSIESLQNLYKLNSNDVGAIELIIVDKESVMDIKNKLSAQDLFLNNNLSIVTVQDKYNNIFNWISIFDFNILIVIILMIIVAIISIIISMLTLIFERIKMIGIMSSMGADNKLLGKVFVYQGIDILLKGIIPGNILFIIVSFVQNNYNILKLNPNDYYVDSIPFIVDPLYIISLNLIFAAIGIIILFVTFSSITRFVPTININT